MKKFEVCINTVVEKEGRSDVEVAQSCFSYLVLKNKETAGFDNIFEVLVTFNELKEQAIINVSVDKDAYEDEAEEIVWETIAEEFIVEVK